MRQFRLGRGERHEHWGNLAVPGKPTPSAFTAVVATAVAPFLQSQKRKIGHLPQLLGPMAPSNALNAFATSRTLQGPIESTTGPGRVPAWVEKLAWLMDRSIPIGNRWSIGLDGIVGLFPGVGDLAGALASALIVASATQAGLPRAAIARMMANVAVDTLLGGIPLIGDLFDVAFKANTKNIRIYRDHLQGRHQTMRNWSFALAVALGLLALAAVPVAVLIYLFRWFLA